MGKVKSYSDADGQQKYGSSMLVPKDVLEL